MKSCKAARRRHALVGECSHVETHCSFLVDSCRLRVESGLLRSDDRDTLLQALVPRRRRKRWRRRGWWRLESVLN